MGDPVKATSHSGAADLPPLPKEGASSINSNYMQELGHLYSGSRPQYLPVRLTGHHLASPTRSHMTSTSTTYLELSFYSDQGQAA